MKKDKVIIIIILLIIFLTLGIVGLIIKKIDENKTNKKEKVIVNTELSSGTYKTNIQDKEVIYNAAYIVDGIDATIGSGVYESVKNDEVVFLVVNGGSLTIKNTIINKKGDSSIDEVYGINSAIAVIGNDSKAVVDNVKLNTDGKGANAVFSTNNSKVEISDSAISTIKDSSKALYSTYGGNITASNTNITTNGDDSTALESDKLGASIKILGTSTIKTEGEESHIIHSNGNVQATGINATSNNSESMIIDGKNTVYLNESTITSNGKNVIMIYQSIDGAEAEKNASTPISKLTMKNCNINYKEKGPIIYVTNTYATINLTNNKFKTSGNFITAEGSKWGVKEKNGGKVIMVMSKQKVVGDVYADPLSAVTMRINNKSSYTGTTTGTVGALTDNTSVKHVKQN